MRWLLLSIGDTSIKLTWCSNNSMNKIQYYNKTPLFTPRLLCEELNGPLFISSLKWREIWTWGHKSPTPQAGKHNKAEQSEDVRESSAASAFISLFVCLFVCLFKFQLPCSLSCCVHAPRFVGAAAPPEEVRVDKWARKTQREVMAR